MPTRGDKAEAFLFCTIWFKLTAPPRLVHQAFKRVKKELNDQGTRKNRTRPKLLAQTQNRMEFRFSKPIKYDAMVY